MEYIDTFDENNNPTGQICIYPDNEDKKLKTDRYIGIRKWSSIFYISK